MAYEALQDMAPAYLVHYASAILASFHFHTIPNFPHLKALALGFPLCLECPHLYVAGFLLFGFSLKKSLELPT